MYLSGRYKVSVDERNRIILPAEWRDEIKDMNLFLLYVDPDSENFELYRNIFPDIITGDYRFAVLFVSLPEDSDPNRQWIINQICQVTMDKQRRVLLRDLRKSYGDKVYVLGQGNRIEIWPIKEYDKRMRDIKNSLSYC